MGKFKKAIKVPKHLDAYIHFKNVDDIVAASKTDSTLQKLLKQITVKRTVTGGVIVAGGIGLGTYVSHYINENSGCFLTKGNDICKVRELSCCNPGSATQIADCKLNLVAFQNACDNYSSSEKECCRQCDASLHALAPGQFMICKTPTVIEAIGQLTSGSTINSLFKALSNITFIRYFIIGFVFVIAFLFIWKLI